MLIDLFLSANFADKLKGLRTLALTNINVYNFSGQVQKIASSLKQCVNLERFYFSSDDFSKLDNNSISLLCAALFSCKKLKQFVYIEGNGSIATLSLKEFQDKVLSLRQVNEAPLSDMYGQPTPIRQLPLSISSAQLITEFGLHSNFPYGTTTSSVLIPLDQYNGSTIEDDRNDNGTPPVVILSGDEGSGSPLGSVDNYRNGANDSPPSTLDGVPNGDGNSYSLN